MKRHVIMIARILMILAVSAMPGSTLSLARSQQYAATLQSSQKQVSFSGVSFSYDSSLASDVTGDGVPTQPGPEFTPWEEAMPAHLLFGFDNYPVATADSLGPHILVFDVAQYKSVVPIQAQDLDDARSLIARRANATDLQLLIHLPPVNAGHAVMNVKYLPFNNGLGVRYITYFRQDLYPVQRDELTYAYLGFTSDGKYLIAADFPIDPGGALGTPPAPTAGEDVIRDYNARAESILDRMASNQFMPDLAKLDAMLSSLALGQQGSPSAPRGPELAEITIFGGIDKSTGFPDFTVPQRAETLRRQEVWLRVENPGGTAIQGGSWTASITLKAPDGTVLERYSYSSSRDNLPPIENIAPNRFTFKSLAPLRLFTPLNNGTLEVSLTMQGYPATTKSRQIAITSPDGSTDSCLAAVTALALRPILSDISEIPGTAAEPLAEALINCNQRDVGCLFKETANWLAEKAPNLLGKTAGKATDLLVLSYELLFKQEETYQALVDRGCLRMGAWMNAMMFAMRHKGSTKNSVTTESPVYPLVKDGSGRRSGFLPNGQPIQEIPESRAIVLGDKHLILFDGADNAQVEIVGYANGTMDMHTFFVHADGTATSATFVDVPVNRGMQVKGASSDVQSNLTVDSNGDGQTDGMLTPSTHNIVPAPSSAPGNIPGGNSYSFPQTGFSVSGRLWELWRSNRSFDDSLYINGFPITSLRPEVSTTDGKVYQTQWFERARFEEHPENQAPHDVLLGLLGVSAAKGRENEAPFRPVGNPGGGIVWFLETQHTLGDSSEGGKAIAAYWNRLGGLPQFGFPLSQPFMEKSKDDGKMYLVQYFQRQRFEYHQENKGTRYEVLLGRLGAEQEERAPSSAVGKLAFTSERNGNTEVHVISADGSQQKQLTNSPPKNQSPSWSPDGKRLVFLSGRSGGDQLYVMNDDGTSQMQLTKTPPGIDPALWSARIDQPAWSPSGQSIAFVSVGTENRADIYTINADGTNLRRITSSPAIDSSPVWSPDGSRLAFVTDRDHQPDIYVMNADGSSQIRVGDASPGDSSPTWSPDGKRIAFQADANPGTHAVYIVNADGSSQRRLTEDKGEGLPAWSPDGRRIAFTSAKTGTPSIYVINTDGTGQTLLTSGPEDRDPEWSPDGQWIAFESRRDGNWQIYVVSSDGSTQMRLTHNSTNDHHPVWAPH